MAFTHKPGLAFGFVTEKRQVGGNVFLWGPCGVVMGFGRDVLEENGLGTDKGIGEELGGFEQTNNW